MSGSERGVQKDNISIYLYLGERLNEGVNRRTSFTYYSYQPVQDQYNNLQVNVELEYYWLVVLANGVITVSNQIGWNWFT